MWINNDKKVLWVVCVDGCIIFLLWDKLINIIIEKDAVINDMINIIKIEWLFHVSKFLISKISLKVFIEGGAEILAAININHQNVILGNIINIPLNEKIFREWYFIYKSLVNMKRADEVNPWAIIIIIAPSNPILFKVISPVNTNPIWATEE